MFRCKIFKIFPATLDTEDPMSALVVDNSKWVNRIFGWSIPLFVAVYRIMCDIMGVERHFPCYGDMDED